MFSFEQIRTKRFEVNAILVVGLLIFVTSISTTPDSRTTPDSLPQDDEGYENAIIIMGEFYDWSTEQINIRNARVNPPRNHWAFINRMWVVGLRGKDSIDRWYKDAECMGMLLTPRAILTVCACVFSWYSSFITGSDKFQPDPMRNTSYDITTRQIYAFHVIHEGDRYFHEEEMRYYEIMNQPLKSEKCDQAHASKSSASMQYSALVLLPLYYPVTVSDTLIAIPRPLSSSISDSSTNASVLTYGASSTDQSSVFREAKGDSIIHIPNELVGISITMDRREKCSGPFESRQPGYECWNLVSKELCNILPGSPVELSDGKPMGIAMNKIACTTYGEPKRPVEVRRISKTFTSDIEKLMAVYSKRLEEARLAETTTINAYQLYNYTPGVINYDEEFNISFARFKSIVITSDGTTIQSKSAIFWSLLWFVNNYLF